MEKSLVSEKQKYNRIEKEEGKRYNRKKREEGKGAERGGKGEKG